MVDDDSEKGETE